MAEQSNVPVIDTETAAFRAAVTDPPVWDKQVLELVLEWPDLPAAERWAVGRLRVVLLTWDPFEWQPGRPAAFATTARGPDGPSLVLYLPLWQALALAGGETGGVAAVIGQLAESVLAVATEHRAAISEGTFAANVAAADRPGLLSRIPDVPSRAAPLLDVVGGWQPIQFDVLEDLAQDAFGPAELDRSPLRFSEPGSGLGSHPDCPGCRGETVDFPDGVKDAQDAICGPHRAEALRVTTARLETARASNPRGWDALIDAGQRLQEPHLPNGLGPRLVAAAAIPSPSRTQLLEQLALVNGAARLMNGLPDPATALGARMEPVRAWLSHFPDDLEAHGLTGPAEEGRRAAAALLAPLPPGEGTSGEAGDAAPAKAVPYHREPRVGRNALCPCGSGKKFKFCHGSGR
jgi:hypothetical protein